MDRFVSFGNEDSVEDKFKGLTDVDSFRDKMKYSITERGLKELKFPNCNLVSEEITNYSRSRVLKSLKNKIVDKGEVYSSTCDGRECFSGAVEMTRLQYEEEVRQGRLARVEALDGTRLGLTQPQEPFVRIIKKPRPDFVHSDHPINHLVEIHKELFPLPPPCKKRKFSSECNDLDEVSYPLNNSLLSSLDSTELNSYSTVDDSSNMLDQILYDRTEKKQSIESYTAVPNPGTFWDVKETPIHLIASTEEKTDQPLACFPIQDNTTSSSILKIFPNTSSGEKIKTDFSKNFIMLPDKDKLIPLDEIKLKRICPRTLLQQFPSYCPGQPSRTLYIKNIARDCSAWDLVYLLGNFDTGSERVCYRLLRGRMKGQAFARFANTTIAAEALDACHGFILKGKPLVITFGNEKS